MSQSFDDPLLHDFMQTFYGYGNFQGAYWFIGMEEGGGDSFEEVTRRLDVWQRRGRRTLEDVAGYHLELGISYPFTGKARLQPTWAKLIRVLLSAEGQTPTKEDVRAYQHHQWARSTSNVCLLELLPLPSPSTQHWLYAEHSHLPELSSRERYQAAWTPRRVQALRQHIAVHRPRAVIFYGQSYREHWAAIAGAALQPALNGEIAVHAAGACVYVAMKHPATAGVTSAYFHAVGQYMQSIWNPPDRQATSWAST